MSRNKENIPIPSSRRQNGSLLSTSKQLPSDEFFTDSLLDATRLSSRIPSPSPQKAPLTKSRRARTTRTARHAQPPLQRSATIEGTTTRPHNKISQPATPLKNGTSPSRARAYSLTSTPDSKDELPPASPYSGIFSPPSQDLTDTYQRIEDEEDLAQTERELSSDDGNPSDADSIPRPHPKQRSKSESPAKPSFAPKIPSSASTPTRSINSLHRRNGSVGQAETLSEASGLSFLKEMTDQDLAAKLTPHVSASARDRARVRNSWDNGKPIAFSKALPHRKFNPKGESQLPVPKVTAFSKALKPLPNPILYQNQRDDRDTRRPASQQSGADSHHSSNGTRHSGDREEMPTNKRVDRHFQFSTNHGFPPPRPALTEQNLEQQNRGSPNRAPSLRSQSSLPSLHSDISQNNARVMGEGVRMTNGQVSRVPTFRRSFQAEAKPIMQEPSQLDWAAAAAEVPLPSVENSSSSGRKESTPVSTSRIYSPERSRRWDNDFTGQSFQVSESPPVRQVPVVQEKVRDREIEGVAKQAVATNRLSQIREQQSLESLRNASRSPAPRSTPRSSDPKLQPILAEEDQSEVLAEPVPDTPVVIFRSSSNGANDKATASTTQDRPNMDRSRSHDQLQRLARAMSSTPRSSPASASENIESQHSVPLGAGPQSSDVQPIKIQLESTSLQPPNQSHPVVAQTPKVVGAWTDTILPDTAKVVRQADSRGYAQTPHVSAGGWIDTPAPVNQQRYSGTIPMIVEEVPEELTAGIGKDTASSDTIKVEIPPEVEVIIPTQDGLPKVEPPRSALGSILNKQKDRLVSQDITTANREDTLNLGNDTIESLQDLLDLDENDLTTLSRLSLIEEDTKPLGAVQAEAELLERLGVKLDRLRTNLQDARKGISKLEFQFSNPPESAVVPTTAQQLLNETICTVCNQQTFTPHHHDTDTNVAATTTTSTHFPHTSLSFSLPIPLLFHPRKPNQWLPRPTILGALTLVIWLWYLIENIMCELYCRPEYTDFYIWPPEPEPVFPFVLPTMLARWTRLNKLAIARFLHWIWNVVAGLVRAAWRVLGMSLGWSDGFVDDRSASKVVKKVVETTTTAVVSAVTGVDVPDLSMNDDEYV